MNFQFSFQWYASLFLPEISRSQPSKTFFAFDHFCFTIEGEITCVGSRSPESDFYIYSYTRNSFRSENTKKNLILRNFQETNPRLEAPVYFLSVYYQFCWSRLGDPLFFKMADHLILCSIFNVKHDGTIDFSGNQKS